MEDGVSNGGTCSTHGKDEKWIKEFCSDNRKGTWAYTES